MHGSTKKPELYDRLCQQIETETHRIHRRNPHQVHCRKGCDSCCRIQLFLLPVEFDRLRRSFLSLPAGKRTHIQTHAHARWEKGICPLLVDGACSLYDVRPMICRTHGYPLYSEVGADTPPRVSVCHLNFIDKARIEEQDLIDIDSVGLMIVGANQEYCKTIPAHTVPSQDHPMLDVVA